MGEELLAAVPALAPMAAYLQELAHGTDEPGSSVDLSGHQRPVQGGPQVVVLNVEHPQPRRHCQGQHAHFGPFAQFGVKAQVSVAGGGLFARDSQLFGGVGPDRLQQPVAVAFVVDLGQGLVDQ